MKILHLVPYFDPALAFGGPAKVVAELARAQNSFNQVTVFTSDVFSERRRFTLEERTVHTSLHVQYFRNLFPINWAYRFRFFSHFGVIPAFIRQHKNFEIVHFHDVFILPHLIVALICRQVGIPYVVSPHGVLDAQRLERKKTVKSILLQLMVMPFLRNAQSIIATSDQEKQDLLAMGFKDVETVFNGLEIKPRQNRVARLPKRTSLQLLYIGKLHPQKGLGKFVRALQSSRIPWNLVLAGPDDGEKDSLLRIHENSLPFQTIEFIDYADDAQKQVLYQQADFFVYPSFSEGFSISILEALEASLPVIFTDRCNFPQLVEAEGGVQLISHDPIAKWGKQLKWIAHLSLQERKKMGVNGHRLLLERYTISAMANEVQKVYKRVTQY